MPVSDPIDLGDLQGNVLCGYGDEFSRAAHVFCRVDDPAAAAAWVASLADRVTTAHPWDVTKPSSTLNIAISWAGLQKLGLPDEALDAFPPEFRAGMAARAPRLKDDGPDAPEHWQPSLNDNDTHLLVSVHARGNASDPASADTALDAALAGVQPAAGVTALVTEKTHALAGGREHFGYSDGLSQPSIDDKRAGPWNGQGTPPRRRRGVLSWKDVAAGEFVLGYPDEDQVVPKGPAPFDRNATYMVVRKLHQDVAAWHKQLLDWTDGHQTAADQLGARIVGRWQNGTPVANSPIAPDPVLDLPSGPDPAQRASRFKRLNDFRYADDPGGERCPVGAHIRRANPRDAFGDGRLSRRHRIIRRGMPYGDPPADPLVADDTERGLLFICFQASIARQFELIQGDWLQDGDAFGLGTDRDVLLSPGGEEGGKMIVPGKPPSFYTPHSRTITLRGGGYFIVPSISALKALNKA
jgi:Dyp-type peroxidase family